MKNYTLHKGPCSFLNLCTSPWEVPFLFLLCFSSLWRLLFPHRRHLSLSLCCSFFPPCGSRRAGSRRLREGAGGGVRGTRRAVAARRGGRLQLASGGARRGRAAQARERGRRRARAEAGGWRPGARAGVREAWSRRVSGTRARQRWSGRPWARGGAAGAGSGAGASGVTHEQEWSPGPGRARLGRSAGAGRAAGARPGRARV
jgi:hypothetical protein